MARERAMPTRCCWPPESSAGRWAAVVAEADQVEHGADAVRGWFGAGCGGSRRGMPTFSAAVRIGEQGEGLEDEADGARGAARSVRGGWGPGLAEDPPAVDGEAGRCPGRSRPPSRLSSEVLPAPERAARRRTAGRGGCRRRRRRRRARGVRRAEGAAQVPAETDVGRARALGRGRVTVIVGPSAGRLRRGGCQPARRAAGSGQGARRGGGGSCAGPDADVVGVQGRAGPDPAGRAASVKSGGSCTRPARSSTAYSSAPRAASAASCARVRAHHLGDVRPSRIATVRLDLLGDLLVVGDDRRRSRRVRCWLPAAPRKPVGGRGVEFAGGLIGEQHLAAGSPARRRWPPAAVRHRKAGRATVAHSRPCRAISSSAARRAARDAPGEAIGRTTFSAALRYGSRLRAVCCQMKPTTCCGRRADRAGDIRCRSQPATLARPAVGTSRPERMLSRVDLPDCRRRRRSRSSRLSRPAGRVPAVPAPRSIRPGRSAPRCRTRSSASAP